VNIPVRFSIFLGLLLGHRPPWPTLGYGSADSLMGREHARRLVTGVSRQLDYVSGIPFLWVALRSDSISLALFKRHLKTLFEYGCGSL